MSVFVDAGSKAHLASNFQVISMAMKPAGKRFWFGVSVGLARVFTTKTGWRGLGWLAESKIGPKSTSSKKAGRNAAFEQVFQILTRLAIFSCARLLQARNPKMKVEANIIRL